MHPLEHTQGENEGRDEQTVEDRRWAKGNATQRRRPKLARCKVRRNPRSILVLPRYIVSSLNTFSILRRSMDGPRVTEKFLQGTYRSARLFLPSAMECDTDTRPYLIWTFCPLWPHAPTALLSFGSARRRAASLRTLDLFLVRSFMMTSLLRNSPNLRRNRETRCSDFSSTRVRGSLGHPRSGLRTREK